MPAWMPMPAKANTPDIGIEPPITMSSPCACTPPTTLRPPAAAIAPSTARRVLEMLICSPFLLMSSSLWICGRPSGPERVQVKEPSNAPPDLGQAMRLEDQEADDQRAEHDR